MMFNTKIVRPFLLNLLSLSLSFTSFLLICVHLKRIGVSSDSIFFARDKPGGRFDKIFRQVTLAFHKWVLRRTHARKCMIDVCVTGFVRSDGEQHVSYGQRRRPFPALDGQFRCSFFRPLPGIRPSSVDIAQRVRVRSPASSSKYPTNLWHVLGENK